MKKYILGVVCLFATSLVHADTQGAEHVGTLAGQILVGETNGFFILSDGSCWKTASFVTRWRSPFEWWNGVDLTPPQNFQTTPKDWMLGAPIEVHAKMGLSSIDISNASNATELNQSTHVMINQHTGHVLFGVSLAPSVAMMEIFKTGHAAGFQEGVQKGSSETRQAAHKEGYNEGRQAAYQEGYNEGRQAAYQEGYNEGRQSAHQEGYNEGRQAAYLEGYNEGRRVAYEEGFNEGRAIAHQEGYNQAYNEGLKKGEAQGYELGYSCGLAERGRDE